MRKIVLIIIAIFFANISSAYPAKKSIPLREGMSLLKARKLLFSRGWKPQIVHSVEPIGVENQARDIGIAELENCTMSNYQQFCLFHYTKGGKCLGVSTRGEEIKDMVVYGWDYECPEQEEQKAK